MSGREFRVGEGWDVHRLVEGRRLLLGGLEIPFERGELGHSDGDVLLHALIDALLGAAALGDIGAHFPPSDARWKDADSLLLLARTVALVAAEGWRIVNADCTVVLERPRLRPHVEAIRARVAAALGLEVGRVSVKAKTAEGLGPIGSGEAVEARAVVLIDRVR
ncbi:MAG: 2-C-methyl-D-erythritol 2,4-cyclodiphosphate synthase [Spirochaetia bacterium]|nr:2-C-methyl-D-erythritol 2,4-cyclodiphosphate synthase [Spirochaetia bacterium]